MPGSSGRPASGWAMSSSSTPLATVTAPKPGDAPPGRALTVAYLALVREARPERMRPRRLWHSWYRFFPWEDWRDGKPAVLTPLEGVSACGRRQAAGEAERRLREERLGLAFATSWNEELVLERYELLYEAGADRRSAGAISDGRCRRETAGLRAADGGRPPPHPGHRDRPAAGQDQISAGRVRADAASLHPASIAAHGRGAAGVRLHKQNFRRLVEQQGLVEETGGISATTGGRPARLVRFRREVLLERPAPGLRLRAGRRTTTFAANT